MESVQNKLNNFENLVMSDATDKKHDLISECEKKKKEKLDKCELEFLENARMYIRREIEVIDKNRNETVMKEKIRYKQEILRLRNRLIDELFDCVKCNILKFVNDDQTYSEWFFQQLDKLTKEYEISSGTIKIRRQDEKLVPQIKSENFGIEYFDSDDMIGGFEISNESFTVIINNTLKNRLDREKEEFLAQHNELEIV